MKRWVWLIPVIAVSMLLLIHRSTSPDLIRLDSDSSVMMAKIQERNDALSWFRGDWPLENGFYRPITTLSFEMDRWLYGDKAVGYALTNALLAIGCVWALLWFAWEVSQSKWIASATAALFGVWMLRAPQELGTLFGLAAMAPVAGIVVARQIRWQQFAAAGAWVLLSYEIWGMVALRSRTLDWLPGRTASTMTLFGLAALACLVRYVRSVQGPPPIAPSTAMDLPATKSSVQILTRAKPRHWHLVLATVMATLSFMSYEQGLVVALIGFGVAMATPRLLLSHRLFSAAFMLAPIFVVGALRLSSVASQPSAYQEQQFRDGPAVWIAICDYILPPSHRGWVELQHGFQFAELWLTATPYAALLVFFGSLAVWRHLGSARIPMTVGFIGSYLAFAPMAWLKYFEHYHFLPMAFRSLFVVGLFLLAIELTVSAVRRPTLALPRRRDPAPGSLPHP